MVVPARRTLEARRSGQKPAAQDRRLGLTVAVCFVAFLAFLAFMDWRRPTLEDSLDDLKASVERYESLMDQLRSSN